VNLGIRSQVLLACGIILLFLVMVGVTGTIQAGRPSAALGQMYTGEVVGLAQTTVRFEQLQEAIRVR
jgi:hypothetical protein